jgi:hypothetical protein
LVRRLVALRLALLQPSRHCGGRRLCGVGLVLVLVLVLVLQASRHGGGGRHRLC